MESGVVRDLIAQAGSRVSELAERLDQGGIDEVASDVVRFARRRPIVFLAGAVTAGFVVGRLVRGAQAASSAENSGSSYSPPRFDAVRQGSAGAALRQGSAGALEAPTSAGGVLGGQPTVNATGEHR